MCQTAGHAFCLFCYCDLVVLYYIVQQKTYSIEIEHVFLINYLHPAAEKMLCKYSIGKFVIIQRSLVTKVPSIKFPTEKFNAKVSYWMQMYEEFVGLTEVKAAQSRVLDVRINKLCKAF